MTELISFSNGHALLVGVNEDTALQCVAQDIEGMHEVITSTVYCGYEEKNVTKLLHPNSNKSQILLKLNVLKHSLSSEDIFMFYFSGHGLTKDNEYYLVPSDSDLTDSSLISVAELKLVFEGFPTKKCIILLDCCKSGGFAEASFIHGSGVRAKNITTESLKKLSEGSGFVIITSSREDQTSLTGNPYSLFTIAIIESLLGINASKKDGFVRIADLYGHAARRVPELANQYNHIQEPVMDFIEADNFVVSYYAGGDKTPKDYPDKFRLETIDTVNVESLEGRSVDSIEDLLINGEIAEAFEKFRLMARSDRNLINSINITLSNYNDLEDKYIKGIITDDDYTINKARIKEAFFKLTDKYKTKNKLP